MIDTFEFSLPTKIIFGWGSLEKLGKEASNLGSKAILITGRKSLKEAGILDNVIKDLDEHEVRLILFSDVEVDPSIETIDKAVSVAKKEGCNLVIGIGGGSVLDTAKSVSGLINENGEVKEYLAGKEIQNDTAPFIAVPTTAGTGSEVTKNAVITDKERRIKISFRSFKLIPKIALVDPSLTVTMPKKLTSASGMDALSHAIEAYLSKNSNEITDSLAATSIRLIGENLLGAFNEGSNKEYRENMMFASVLAGMAFANAGLGLVHALSHPLGPRFNIPHGVACALMLPYVMEFNILGRLGKISEIASLLGENVENRMDTSHIIAIEKVRSLVQQVGLPTKLTQIGFTKKNIESIVEDTKFSGSLRFNPRTVTPQDIENILKKAL